MRQFYSSSSEFCTFVELLRERALHSPEQCAYTFLLDGDVEESRLTYAELDSQARSIAALLQRYLAPGDPALLLYPPGLDYIAAFFGCLYAGVVAVPAYPPQLSRSLSRIQSIAADVQATVALTTRQTLAHVEHRLTHIPDLQGLQWLVTDTLTSNLADSWQEIELHRDSLAFLQYTSGSTAAPKGVMLTHDNLLHNSALIHQCFEHSPDSRGVIWLPPYHDMGLIGGILQPLYGGFPVTLMSPIAFLQRPLRWLQAISRYQATTSGGPNFAYDLCVQKITPEQRLTLDLSNWEVSFNGAEPIHPETLEQFSEAFAPCGFRREAFYPCYGLAEATLLVSGGKRANPPTVQTFQSDALGKNQAIVISEDTLETALETTLETTVRPRTLIGCGQSLNDQQIVIVNPESLSPCLPDQVGEIWVSGNSVAQGYWNKLEQTEQTFRATLLDHHAEVFLRTGDLGFFHAGELFVTGRLKDLIIIRGRNHYPQDIEKTVGHCHPALQPASGTAFSIEVTGEERLIVVQEVKRRYLRHLNADEVTIAIRQAVAEQHELQVYGVLLLKTGSVPKTSSGKIQRHACRAGFLNGSLDSISQSILAEGTEVAESNIAESNIAESNIAESNITLLSENLSRDVLLAIAPAERQDCLTDYLQRQVAQVLKKNLHLNLYLNPQLPLSSFGLDSLMAIELRHEIETRLGIILPMERFFQDVALSQLANEMLAQLTTPEHQTDSALTPEQIPEQVPEQTDATEFSLSYGQRSLWFLHQLASESSAYNIAIAVRTRTTLNIPALKRAFLTLVERHPALRTTFAASHTVFQREPYQQVQAQMQNCWQQQDASTWSEAFLNQQLVQVAHAPFNLEQGPLLQITLFIRSAQEQVLLLTAHHIVTDLWSMAVLTHELGILYQAEQASTPAHLPPLSAQYRNYVHWQAEQLASPAGERLWSYWQQQLAGELPVLNLPTDHPRPLVQTDRGASHCFKLGAELSQSLKSFSRVHGVTLYMTLLAAFQVLLHRYTGQDDLLVGSPTVGRSRAEWTGLVGYFVNPVVLRANLSSNPTFEIFLRQVRQTVLDAFEHQDYPLALLVERLQPNRDPSRSPLFQTMFVWQKAHLLHEAGLTALALGETGVRMQWGDLEVESVALEQRIAQFDLTLTMAETDAELIATLEYNTDLFEADTIARMAGHFQTLLAGIITNPRQSLATLPLLTEAEQHQLLVEFNPHSFQNAVLNQFQDQFQDQFQNSIHTQYATCDITPCIHSLFEAQVEQTPDAIAVSLEHDQISYRELNNRANQLAHYLQALGVMPETRVGICVERSIEMLVGAIGILKAGGAYVPLDPAYPSDRLAYLLHDAQLHLLLTQDRFRPKFSDYSGQTLYLDADWDTVAQHCSNNPVSPVQPHHLAYLIYTSGSTGNPKGVMIEHRSLLNFATVAAKEYGISCRDRVLQFASFSFDAAVEEIYPCLLTGGTLVLRTDQILHSHHDFWEYCRAWQLTVLDLPTAYWYQITTDLVPQDLRIPDALRLVIVGGEEAEAQQVNRWHAAVAHLPNPPQLINSYGPTEATVVSTLYRFHHAQVDSAPIGQPIGNAQVYVLNPHLKPLPIGVPGELYIGGMGVARGYLNRPELTAERFIPNPFILNPHDSDKTRLYKTGDWVRYRSDGNLEYLGRMDTQVKIRGFRIELGEIAAMLRQHPTVQETVVVVHEMAREDHQLGNENNHNNNHKNNHKNNQSGDKRLIAYVVAAPQQTLSTRDLRQFLKNKLPDYMVPAIFMPIAALPLTPNGKLDHQNLPAPDWTRLELDVAFAAPRNAVETVLTRIWAEVLGLETVGIYDNFFELGGHSLLATQIVSRIRDLFRIELPLHKLFEATTVADLSQVVITHELKPGQSEKLAQVFQKIEQVHQRVEGMSAEAVREVLQQKQRERSSERSHEISNERDV